MSDNRHLRDKLQKLASEASSIQDGWRRVGPDTDGGVLAVILTEIDETLLPRKISLRNERGAILRLEAGNRRLWRFISPAPEGLESFEALFNHPISDPSNTQTERLAALLKAFESGKGAVWLHAEPLADGATAGPTGISAVALARAWSMDLSARRGLEPDKAYEKFSEVMVSFSEAWIWFDAATIVKSSQPGTHVPWQQNCASVEWRKQLNAHAGPKGTDDAPALGIFASNRGAETVLLVATFKTLARVAVAKSEHLQKFTDTWRKLGL